MSRFDHIVLTAANDAQARGYQAQIDWRLERGVLDAATTYHVIADPKGQRVGSLGATLNVLKLLAEHLAGKRKAKNLAGLFQSQRILICHSGGDSRRLPAYAAQGKVFCPLPTATQNNQPAALFDLLVMNMAALSAPAAGQVLIISGDVLLTFDPAAVDFDAPGVVGVAYPGPMERGRQHGVYVADRASDDQRRAEVCDFLQKPDEQTAAAHGAVDAVGRVLVDTGILSFDPATTAKLLTASGVSLSAGKVKSGAGILKDVIGGQCPSMDLYVEMAMAMPRKIDADRYGKLVIDKAAADAAHRKRLTKLYHALHGVGFSVNVLPYCDFFHIGTSRELLANVATLNRTAETYGFANLTDSVIHAGASLEGAFVYNALISSGKVRASSGALIEASEVNGSLQLPGRNILVGLPGDLTTAIELREGLGLVCLPIGETDWVAVLYGVKDDFKGAMGSDLGCSYLNELIERWLTRHGVGEAQVWSSGAPRNLWEAKLWAVGTIESVIKQITWMQSDKPQPRACNAWKRRKRISMAQILPRVNHQRLISQRQEIGRVVALHTLGKRLVQDDCLPASQVVQEIHTAEEANLAVEQIAAAVDQRGDALFASRAKWLAHQIADRHRIKPAVLKKMQAADSEALGKAAFAAIGQAVAQTVRLSDEPRQAGILHDQVVWATTPVRIDFSGGWSDTPPFCTERGGTVINAAITLNGQYPVQVMAKLNEEKIIRLSSIDLGRGVELRTTGEVLDHMDPRDWAALPKAAMVLAGVAPGRVDQSLGKWLEVLGGGLDLTIFSALPKGSGMGTSSILGAAVLACLGRVLGQPLSTDQLFEMVSVLEQRMTTGGGWQDQVGGVVPGVKLIRTQPGTDQTPSLSWAVFDTSPTSVLGRRLLLYFTGQKRMAKNILQNVVGRYLSRDPEALRTIDELKDAAVQMKADLDAQDIDAFGRGIEHYWTLKKRLDPGSTNPAIEKLIGQVDKWCAGKLLPGAGGGGFVFMVAHDEEAAGRIRKQLTTHAPNAAARFFDFAVDQTGLKVTVL